MNNNPKYIIGIDEAGRGPLAGPVAVGITIIPVDFEWELIPGVGDSKKVSEKKREAIFLRTVELQKAGLLDYSVILMAAAKIDAEGIVPSINQALAEGLRTIHTQNIFPHMPGEVMVKLDGGLKAPEAYVLQETIIKGDSKEKVIGLASIMAKVTRDKFMVAIAELPEYAVYNFATHKGYGTKAHRERISQYGLSNEHRETFCRNIFSKNSIKKT